MIGDGIALLTAQHADHEALVSDERIAELVDASVEYASNHTTGQIRQWISRRVVTIDPYAAEVRRQRAMADRRVVITPVSDGMSELWALLPSVQARQIQQSLNAIAHDASTDDPRTADQRRSDALCDVLLGKVTPPQVQLNLVVSAIGSVGSADLAGVGTVTIEQAQELLGRAVAARPRVVPCDAATGYLTPAPTIDESYRPSRKLDESVRLRDLTCRFPGCRRAATGSASGVDVDHTVPWPAGSTEPSNLACLCRRHHRLKHTTSWTLEQGHRGVLVWTGPTGRKYPTTPWQYTDPLRT